MPRPKVPGGPEPKKRSRNGCWPCKHKKVKCDEAKPGCLNCEKTGQTCDYKIVLIWGGRTKRKVDTAPLPGSEPAPDLAGPTEGSTDGTEFEESSNQSLSPRGGSQPAFRFSPDARSPSQSTGSPDQSSYAQSLHLARVLPSLQQQRAMYQSNFQGGHSTQAEHMSSGDERTKRLRFTTTTPLDSAPDSLGRFTSHPYGYASPSTPLTAYSFGQREPMSTPLFGSSVGSMNIPFTPPASSIMSERSILSPLITAASVVQAEEDPRRLSVNSLLSSPSLDDNSPLTADPLGSSRTHASSQTITYGIDRGHPDLDTPKNDDLRALEVVTPSLGSGEPFGSENDESVAGEFGFGLYGANTEDSEGGYYSRPVIVRIPKALEPLPSILLENPMNLLYFHHFLNHTASILVPHDCGQNPFKKILPQMAVRDMNLMHLLLAYSASHRARLLNHPEPTNRIAMWMRDVFPTLRRALENDATKISSSNLATAIMLASLEIISPNTFEVPVSWQDHLNIARRMIVATGGPRFGRGRDKVSYFLSSWFVYLDVLGSLSGGKNDQPLSYDNCWSYATDFDADTDFQIDCLLGFTSRCVSILAKIAELARRCDIARFSTPEHSPWIPDLQTIAAAETLKTELKAARTHTYEGCPHRETTLEPAHEEAEPSPNNNNTTTTPNITTTPNTITTTKTQGTLEISATNSAFHWAGLIHLDRRVLLKPTQDPEVQTAVQQIVDTLSQVRKGGTAEACLLFPMFTAGCEALDPAQRELILERVRSVEGNGMAQAKKARVLLQRVWETGTPWTRLVKGEFVG